MDQPHLLDLTNKIQHLLGTAYCKGRNYQITSSVKGSLDNLSQHSRIVRPLSVASVSIGRFHNNISCLFNIYRILNQRLIKITDITGKYDFFLFVILGEPDLNTTGTKKMSCIYKTYLYSFCRFNNLIVRTSDKVPKHSHGIFHSISRYKFRLAFSAALTVSPFCLKHLDVCTVTKHNITEIAGRLCCIDRSLITLGIQSGKIS